MSHAALFLRFLRFGLLAFGGPVAQIAMIRRALVEEERWIGSTAFNRLLAVMQILPGPEAHELCVHLGIRARGRTGGLLAGLGFMAPGLVLMLGLAWLYTLLAPVGPGMQALLLGVQAAVLAVVLKSLHGIARHILTEPLLWVLAFAAAAATKVGVSFWIVLAAAGAAAVLAERSRVAGLLLLAIVLTLAAVFGHTSLVIAPVLASPAIEPASAWSLFLAGLKAGLLTFGGAYAAIPFVRDDTVGRGWLSEGQFLDGLALASVIPAPLIIFATFVGFVSGGPGGALAMTAGIFLPAFAFSLLFYERLESLAEHRRLRRFLAGVAAAVVGLIAVTLFDLGHAVADRTPDTVVTGLILGLALLLVVRWKNVLSVPLALAGGALAGTIALD